MRRPTSDKLSYVWCVIIKKSPTVLRNIPRSRFVNASLHPQVAGDLSVTEPR